MPARKAEAEWKGDLKGGNGSVSLGSGAFSGPYGFNSRFEDGPGTNPEELIGAAHAGCFSMALSHVLGGAGHTPERLHTTATVHIEQQGEGFAIPKIELDLEGSVPGISAEEFQKHAETAKENCPVSKALAGTSITLRARLT